MSTTTGIRARLLSLFPPEPAAPPIRYKPALIVYSAAVGLAAIALALTTVRLPVDGWTLLVGAVAIVGLGLVAVRSFGGVSAAWSPLAFVHLALSLAFGPPGALVSAIAASVVVAFRLRTGWFRALFNLANFFLANLAAWWTFNALPHRGAPSIDLVALDGLVAGAACYAVNALLLSGAVRLESGVSISSVLRSTVGSIPHELAYSVGAAGFAAFARAGGPLYLATWLVPLASLQGFLVVLARRINADAKERERHASERVELLQEIITAAEAEGLKTAGDRAVPRLARAILAARDSIDRQRRSERQS